jgi:glycerol-3-phosphate dehydrogenase
MQTYAHTSAVLITRGLSEMTRIGTAYGASPLTFLGLAGVGDLFLTCSSPASRNYTVGHRLGRGERLPDIVRTLGSVAEGVTTAKALRELLAELGTDVNASIAGAVYEILYEGACRGVLREAGLTRGADKDVAETAKALLELPALKELDLPSDVRGVPARKLMEKLGMA